MSRSVLIVDDHEEFRRRARALLESEGFDVVGEAVDGASALAETARLRPSLVLLDIQLPDMDGFEVAARLARRADPPAILVTSTRAASSTGGDSPKATLSASSPRASCLAQRLQRSARSR